MTADRTLAAACPSRIPPRRRDDRAGQGATKARSSVPPRAAADVTTLDDRTTGVVETLRRGPGCRTDEAPPERPLRAFVDAGTAQVTNNPDADSARQRDRFLAAFAHELRTPLTVAQGWGELVLEGDLPPATVSSTVQRLYDALGRLTRP
jgi:signal transduction histidine kinase